MSDDVEDLLERLVLKACPQDKFEQLFDDEIGDSEDETVLRVFSANVPKKGPCTLYVLKGGFCVVEDADSKWSVYETRERVEANDYFKQWADFCRAGWTNKIPERPGTYPVRDREGVRGHDRTFALINGKLTDVTRGGGYSNKTTQWLGQFWAMPYPALLGDK